MLDEPFLEIAIILWWFHNIKTFSFSLALEVHSLVMHLLILVLIPFLYILIII